MGDDEGGKLFIGSLAWATDERGLGQAFDKFGDISEGKLCSETAAHHLVARAKLATTGCGFD
jgi:hypothetical protein